MGRKMLGGGIGSFVEVRIVDQFNDKEVLFRERARSSDKLAVLELLRNLGHKGVRMPKFEDEVVKR